MECVCGRCDPSLQWKRGKNLGLLFTEVIKFLEYLKTEAQIDSGN